LASTKTHYSDATLANIRAFRAVVDAPVIGGGAYYCHPTFEQHFAGLNTAGDKAVHGQWPSGRNFRRLPDPVG